MPKLNQLLAAAKTVRAEANKGVTEAYHLAQKPALFNGQNRTYQPKDDDGATLPSESQRVQQTVPSVIDNFRATMSRLLDVDAAISQTNMVAKADVKLGDTVVLTGVPVSHLLYLEKRLADVATFIEKLPVLDPSAEWALNTVSDLYETPVVKTHRTQRVTEFKVVVQATEKHPAQVAKDESDQVVGYWSTTRVSGAIPGKQQRALLARVAELAAAVKIARETANMTDVVDYRTSELLDYVFNA